MKTFVLTLLGLFAIATTQAQTTTIKAQVQDSSKNNIAIEAATVVLYNLLDSSVVATVITDENGNFKFNKVPVGGYRIYVSSIQFSSVVQDVVIDGKASMLDLQKIYVVVGKKLEDVTVVGSPIRVAQDTVEFRADAFKTRPNAMVEDLLKKLPGVEVDKQGNIKAGGQQVTKVLVDGKPFFGNDPKMATKNLPANVVDKVQVIDKKSDQAQFTGFDDGSTERVINITIKKDKKKGFFGRANGGYGTEDRYESNISFNRFNNGAQLSIIGQANNINQEGFTFQDMMDFNGMGGFSSMRNNDMGGGGGGGAIMMVRGGGGSFGGQSFGGMPNGLRDTKAAGMNFANSWGKKLTLSSSYFYNRSVNNSIDESNRQNFAADSFYNSNTIQTTTGKQIRGNHRFNLDLDWNIDSANSVLFRPSITFVDNDNTQNTFSTITSKSGNRIVSRKDINNNNQMNLSGTALWKHKFKKKGRTLTMRINGGSNDTDSETNNVNTQTVSGSGTFNNDQKSNTGRNSSTYNLRATYTEPIAKNRILELYYTKNRNANSSAKKTFRKDLATGLYSIFDSQQSNSFDNVFQSQMAGFNVQTKLKKYDYTLGLGVQESDLLSQSDYVQRNVLNYFPNARLNFNFGKNRRLGFNYRGSTNQPTASQLQPVLDISNPVQTRIGNPDLKQEFNNNISGNYSRFNFISGQTFFTFFNVGTTANKIVDSIKNLPSGQQFRKPTNANGNYNILANISMGFPIKFIKTTNFNVNLSVFQNNTVNFIDAKKNITKMNTISQMFGLNHNYKDKLDIMLTANINYTNTKYSIAATQNTNYLNYTYGADISYTFKNNFTIQSDIDYNIYTGRGAGFNQRFALWGASMSKLLLKDKSLELKFTAYDLLKQNRAINRTVQETYIEDSRTNVLTQYFMVSLRYNLNKFGGKGNRTFAMPKMPGMRQMNNVRIGM